MIYPDFYPFYATQGSPGFYNEEREQEKEFDLMRSYYPDTARRIQEKAEAQCQLLDYEGSRLYDEYPDRFMLYHICHQVKGQMEGDTSVQEIPGGFLDDLSDRSAGVSGDFQTKMQEEKVQKMFPH